MTASASSALLRSSRSLAENCGCWTAQRNGTILFHLEETRSRENGADRRASAVTTLPWKLSSIIARECKHDAPEKTSAADPSGENSTERIVQASRAEQNRLALDLRVPSHVSPRLSTSGEE